VKTSVAEYFKKFFEEFGKLSTTLIQTLIWAVRPPYRLKLLIQQMEFIGVKSTFIVVLTGAFTGAVFSIQAGYAFSLFNATYLIGPTVVLSLTRELGPVLTGLMITGRAGSAIATELGTMRVTEQIDALFTMAVNPIHYLVVPRVLAAIIMLPILTALFDFCGTLGSYLVSTHVIGISSATFWDNIIMLVQAKDLFNGMFKSIFFGFILALIGCYKGFYCDGGASGVGKATTESVVIASVTILISDYFFTVLMYGL
jgi:phospholipid/cholesterol/gamma-HCH transport system permease protein